MAETSYSAVFYKQFYDFSCFYFQNDVFLRQIRNIMNYLEFRDKILPLGCFSIQQVLLWFPNFDRTNLLRWVKKGYLIKLRSEYYAFSECEQTPDFQLLIANKIYKPSYISLHSALSFYGIIPEMVVQITSVSTLKTARFTNDFGEFSYNNVKEELYFGYEPKVLKDNRSILFATPEKALLDLLYLYPFYNSNEEIENLRLDDSFMKEELNLKRLQDYLGIFKNKALEKRIKILLNMFDYA